MRVLLLMAALLSSACAPATIAMLAAPAPEPAPAPAPTLVPKAAEAEQEPRFDDLLVDEATCGGASAPSVSRADALRDAAVLERILRGGYAGFEEQARRGVDWEALFARLRSDLESGPTDWPSARLQARLLTALGTVRDRHLQIVRIDPRGRAVGRSAIGPREAFVVDAPEPIWSTLQRCGETPAAELFVPVMQQAPTVRWLPLVLHDSRASAVDCELAGAAGVERRSFPLRRLQSGGAATGTRAFERTDPRGVPHLRLRSLHVGELATLRSFVSSAPKLRSAPVVVLDVRGNPGGTDGPVRSWFQGLTAGVLTYPRVHRLISDVTLQGDVNARRCELARSRLDTSGRAHVERRLQQAESSLREARQAEKPARDWARTTPTHQGAAPAPFGGALVVLADARCASACETLVVYARQLSGTLVVGDHTAGAGEFGEMKLYRLPASGLWLRVGSKWFESVGPAQVARDTVGHAPDVWIDHPDAAGVAGDLARCLAEPGCRTTLTETLRRGPP